MLLDIVLAVAMIAGWAIFVAWGVDKLGELYVCVKLWWHERH